MTSPEAFGYLEPMSDHDLIDHVRRDEFVHASDNECFAAALMLADRLSREIGGRGLKTLDGLHPTNASEPVAARAGEEWQIP